MKHRLRHRYGRGKGPMKFVQYFIYVDGKRLETPTRPGGPLSPTHYTNRKAALEKAKALLAAGHVVEVQRLTHSAIDPYKRVNVRIK